MSNLSKIRPQLRTTGNVTGNFGRPKTVAGSPLAAVGNTDAEVVRIAPRKDYVGKMVQLLECEDPKMAAFAYSELRRLNCLVESRL